MTGLPVTSTREELEEAFRDTVPAVGFGARVVVRPATEDDQAVVLRMAHDFVHASHYRHLVAWNPAHLAHLIAWLSREQLLLVAERAGAVVGMIALAIVPAALSGDPVASEIAWWVDPAHRRSSAAVRLWEAAEAWAHAQGAVLMQMVAPADRPDVGDMYRRRGYEPLEVTWQARIAR